ncbi:hypothetical protein G6F68_015474 [Rhizopus microsporus]|nr:hypothetical protein G6F68_015474 [Rhizopus microsporus]
MVDLRKTQNHEKGTYVLDDLSVLDLNNFTWTQFRGIPPRYNHSATLIGRKMYIYAGKNQQGDTVTDLFVLHLDTPPYTPRLLSAENWSSLDSITMMPTGCGCWTWIDWNGKDKTVMDHLISVVGITLRS